MQSRLSVDLVLFDLGNTLFFDRPASWPRVYRRAEMGLWQVLRKAGVRIPPESLYGHPDTLLNYYYGLRGHGVAEPGTYRALSDLLALQHIHLPARTLHEALREMYSVTQSNWRAEQDAAPTLRSLLKRGFHLGAVSNGSDDANAMALLDRARLRNFFDLVLTSAAHGLRKPDPSIFRRALGHFNVAAERAVMVGDSYEADIIGAHALGIHTIWVKRRAGPPPTEQPVQPDAAVGRLGEVPNCLA